MDDIHDLYAISVVFLYDPLCMSSSIRGTTLGGEENYDILLVWIERIAECDDVLFDDIVWLCIYGYDDDMFQIFGSSRHDCISAPVLFFEFEEADIRLQDIVVRLEHFH